MAGLSDSDDPYELLGVNPQVDARELKRAYVRLIKQFRPEKEPHAFERIRRAYEQLRDRLRAGVVHEQGPPDASVSEPRARSADHDRQVLDGAGAPDAARNAEAAPAEVPVTDHPSVRATREALVALRVGKRERAAELLEELHTRGLLGWEHLRTRPDAHNAVMLFREHADRELMAGRGVALLATLHGSEFQRDTVRISSLETVIWRVLAFTSLSEPEASLRILSAHPVPPQSDDPNLTLLESTLPLAESYRVAREKVRVPAGLARLLELGRLETSEGVGARMVARELATDARAMLAALDGLSREAPDLLRRVLSTVDHWLPADDRLFHELSKPEHAWLTASLEDIDKKLDKSMVGCAPLLLMGLCAALLISGYWSFGFWLGTLCAFLSVCALGVAMVRFDRRFYEGSVREHLVERIARRGVSPDRVMEWCATQKAKTGNLDRFHREIEGDLPLYALASLWRVYEALLLRGAAPAPEHVQVPGHTGGQ